MPLKQNEKIIRSATEPGVKYDTYTHFMYQSKHKTVLLIEQANGRFRLEWNEDKNTGGVEVMNDQYVANETFLTKMRDLGLAEDNTLNKDPKILRG